MLYAFNLISIIIVKLLIDLFIFQLTELHCSFHQNVCKNFQEINYSFSFLKNWSYIIQFWENTEITSQEVAEINVCFYFILSSHILQQIHGLHLIIFQNYMNMLVIYIRLMNILRSQYLFNVSSTVFSMLVLAKL